MNWGLCESDQNTVWMHSMATHVIWTRASEIGSTEKVASVCKRHILQNDAKAELSGMGNTKFIKKTIYREIIFLKG